MAVRDALRRKFKEWSSQESDLNAVYEGMSNVFNDELRKKYRDAATKADNMAAEMAKVADEAGLRSKYLDIWNKVPYEDRRKLASMYKEVWDTSEGIALREKLVKAAISADIPTLYYYAAHGMYDELAKALNIDASKVPHNFADAARLVAVIKGIKSTYKSTWAKA